MAKVHERVFALVAATLFFVTTVAFTGAVLYQMYNDDKQAKADKAQQEILKQLQDQQSATNPPTTPPEGGKLKGTKLTNFTPVAKVDSLQKIDTAPGTGEEVKAGANVTVNYTGALASDGTIFESSLDTGQPASFGLDGVIAGWTQGLPGMKVGGTRRLIIPSGLAYGAQAKSGIPANSDLVFDITLISVKNP